MDEVANGTSASDYVGADMFPKGSWPHVWEVWHFLALGIVSIGGLELVMNRIVPFLCANIFGVKDDIPRSGKHLDTLDGKAQGFVLFSKMFIIIFMYHMTQFAMFTPKVLWGWSNLQFMNTIGPLPIYFMMYDMVYHPWHRIMHTKALYPLVHKHHHQQMVPTRGYEDGINVHPVEFLSGEYLHLLVLKLYTVYFSSIHVVSIVLFILFGGAMASLNHTRFDVLFRGWAGVRYHDIHHSVIPFTKNYSQYTMLWDKVYGTFLGEKVLGKKRK
jgi:sterol desaturase/sphingolipid hydroxylase (fatty acid hydroxylase superfamily)